MRHDEAARQAAVIAWWDLHHREYGVPKEMLWHTPNGGKRNIIEAARLKKQGVRAGVPDLCLAEPSHGKHGLYIEMKTPTGVLTDAQSIMLCDLTARGYETCVCRSADAAISAIKNYLRTGSVIGLEAAA